MSRMAAHTHVHALPPGAAHGGSGQPGAIDIATRVRAPTCWPA